MSRPETHPRGSHPPAPHSRVADFAGAAGGGEPPRPASRRARSNQLIVCVTLICCAALLCFATGCRDSDALKEIIYDQEVDVIDYDTDEKIWINDPNADEESDKASSEDVVSQSADTDVEQYLVVYSSNPNSPEYSAKQSLWTNDTPDISGIEASETIAFYLEEDPDDDDPDEIPEVDSSQISSSSKSGASTEGNSGDTGSGGTGDSDEEGEMASEDADNPTGESGPGAGAGGDKVKVASLIDSTDELTDLPHVDHIAAFGDYAVAVQMVGGEDALVAADEETLAGDGFQTVFADEGAADIAVGWEGDGTDASAIDIDAVIASGAEAILVTSSAYCDDFTNKQVTKINNAGISCVIVYAMTDSSGIKTTVSTIGEILSESDVIGQAHNTKIIAKQYKNFFDSTIKDCVSNNGGLASSNSTTYEYNNSTDYNYDSSANWTLLIDEWDTSVSWSGSSGPTVDGVGLATIGYATTPTSFYIQAGGLINSAAAKSGTALSGSYIVWQFYQSWQGYKKNFTYATGKAFDTSVTTTNGKGDQGIWSTYFGDSLLCRSWAVENSLGGEKGGPPPSGFGTEDFPKLIAGTQQVKEKLIANSAKANGAYHPYDPQDGTNGMYYGSASNQFAWGCIGGDNDMSDNVYAKDGAIDGNDVEVNPCGLVSSWIEGGSVESFLEAVWVNDEVNDSSDLGWTTYVADFYDTFYRYDLGSDDSEEWKTILAGAEE